MLVARARNLKVGNGLDETVEMGPCVNEAQRKSDHSYVEIGLREGAKVACGGKMLTDGEWSKGWFYAPTIFTGVTPEMTIAKEEIFGPVLSVLKVKDLAEAIRVLNIFDDAATTEIYTTNVN